MNAAANARAAADCGALFVANHSGGKDSQAMLIRLLETVPREQLVVVHAALGEVEWPGALEHAQRQAHDSGLPFLVARAGISLLEMVERRYSRRPDVPSWPSASTRQCTSDLKRGPIAREVRRFAKAHGFSAVVNCLGIRAAESPRRAMAAIWSENTRATTHRRQWFDWLPIHGLSTAEVFKTIRAAGQEPHPAYACGNERLSCVFCILGSAADARNGAVHHPELFARYVEIERRTGYTAHQSRRGLEEVAGITVEQARLLHAGDQLGVAGSPGGGQYGATRRE
jgi:3'-phosphoadenosine 5'-phosphosulfate sulfotransferase (PAPS reductase)/FAD synthetase